MSTGKKLKPAGSRKPEAVSTPEEIREYHPDRDHGKDALISTLAGGIAHDLNTVITTIYGYSEMALDCLNNPREAELNIRRIIGAADRARTLTGQLLDMSRRASQEKVPVRVAGVLADTIEFIRPSLPEGIRITRRITASDATINAVPVQLFRIFLNLILNAVQAMSGKGGTLSVSLGYNEKHAEETATETGSHLLIRFSDTGKGMDEATASRIFKPFVTGRENGTGLGLTIVSDAVRELGGTITVRSSVNTGTTFELIIPGAFFGPLPEKL